MIFTTLISASDLAQHKDDPIWAIVDCRFSLVDTDRGGRAYREAHIPRAVYAHLDDDLAGPVIPGKTGRHPLPEVDVFAQKLSNWGVGPGTQVVSYDDLSGAIAARLWWMLRWLGHEAVAVLDGGWQAWERAGYATSGGVETHTPSMFIPQPQPELVVTTEDVMAMRRRAGTLIFDSRIPERFRGEQEPIDPVAGHIPGAINTPHPETIGSDGLFLSLDALRTHFECLLGDTSAENAIFYCGSGVTAARNLLALAHAGLGDALLYTGSWSEWIADPDHPIAKG